MKKMITSALAILLLTGAVQAQAQSAEKAGDRKHQGHRKDMAQQLNLTEDQKARFKTIREEERKELEEVKNNGSLTQDQAKARRREIHEKYREQMKAILTDEQKAEMEKGRKKGKGKDLGQWKNKKQDLPKDLNLTADQQSRMTAISAEFKTKMEAIRNNNSLSNSQKKEQFQALATEHRNQVKSILTPEQQQKMQSLRKENRGRRTAR